MNCTKFFILIFSFTLLGCIECKFPLEDKVPQSEFLVVKLITKNPDNNNVLVSINYKNGEPFQGRRLEQGFAKDNVTIVNNLVPS